MNYFLKAPTGDAYANLARDEFLLNELAPGSIVMYLYINENAVIIGRNQNPRIECDLDKLNADGVQLVRRISGGGAVYHDSGNLNYSFIASNDIYDEQRQTNVIISALKTFGIEAQVSGRNDITANGLKFSGNAFCGRGNNRQHHGTLLISSNLSVFGRYLTPSKQKLESKGIKSVRARVCNLSEMNPDITVDSMAKALHSTFESEYGNTNKVTFTDGELLRIGTLRQKHCSWEWIMGETPHFDCEIERRLPCGNVVLQISAEGGLITGCAVYTDSLNTTVPEKLKNRLIGQKFDDLDQILEGAK